MLSRTSFDEELIGRLLRTLPDPPPAWTVIAQVLPAVREALTSSEERVLAGAQERAAVAAGLGAAMARAG